MHYKKHTQSATSLQNNYIKYFCKSFQKNWNVNKTKKSFCTFLSGKQTSLL